MMKRYVICLVLIVLIVINVKAFNGSSTNYDFRGNLESFASNTTYSSRIVGENPSSIFTSLFYKARFGIMMFDVTPPSIILDAPSNNSAFNTNTTSAFYTKYINLTISDALLSVSSAWWSNDSGVNNYSNFAGSYDVEVTSCEDGTLILTVWANDTTKNEGKEEFTFNIDNTSPGNFSLTNPSDGKRSTDSTPFTDWTDSNESNLDNYTVQFSTNASFTSISSEFYSNSSNYQLENDEALSTGTWYWRVIAFDKVGLSYITENFTYYLGEKEIAETVGVAGAGAGGGKKVIRALHGLEIIEPEKLSYFANKTIIVPFKLVNRGSEHLKNIVLTVESSKLDVSVYPNLYDLPPGVEIDPKLTIVPPEETGQYDVLVTARVGDPSFTDSAKFLITILEFGEGERTQAVEKLKFVVDYIKQNKECVELLTRLDELNADLAGARYEDVFKKTEEAMQSCKNLVVSSRLQRLEKPVTPSWMLYLPLIEIVIFLLLFMSVFSYYKRLKFKRQKF